MKVHAKNLFGHTKLVTGNTQLVNVFHFPCLVCPQIVFSLFGGRQNIFLTIFSTKFVVKCAEKN